MVREKGGQYVKLLYARGLAQTETWAADQSRRPIGLEENFAYLLNEQTVCNSEAGFVRTMNSVAGHDVG
jgi:hypothetical protein